MITYVKGEQDVLSNFYPTPIEFDRDIFKSAEHLYQSRKAIYHLQLDIDDEIRNSPTAKDAKKLSKRIKTDKQMEEIKPIVMAEILKIKFVQCDEFRQKFMSTNGYIAHNVNDNFWGTGKDGKGMNVFGTLLAALRLGVNL